MPTSMLAVAMAVIHVLMLVLPVKAGLRAVIYAATTVIGPMVLEPVVGLLASPLLFSPALMGLDDALAELSAAWVTENPSRALSFTGASKALLISSLSASLFSLAVGYRSTALGSLLVAAYTLLASAYSIHSLKKTELNVDKALIRVLAREEGEGKAVLRPSTSIPLHIAFRSTLSWMEVSPEYVRLDPGGKTELTIRVKPPLAAPVDPCVEAVLVGPRGLVSAFKKLHPVDLHVIPKAKYAEWLAKRFLEGTHETVGLKTVGLELKPLLPSRRGEYYGSRLYHPGDSVRDVDWKKSVKLHKLVVKEFISSRGAVTALIASLTVSNLEEADELCYKMVMASLTAAVEGIPTALVAYNSEQVVALLGPTDPKEILKLALTLAKHVTVEEIALRVLTVPGEGFEGLRELYRRAEKRRIPGAAGLARLLSIKFTALKRLARDHPAHQALAKCVNLIPAPALLVVVSPLSYDAEALMVGLERASTMGYRTLVLPTSKH